MIVKVKSPMGRTLAKLENKFLDDSFEEVIGFLLLQSYGWDAPKVKYNKRKNKITIYTCIMVNNHKAQILRSLFEVGFKLV